MSRRAVPSALAGVLLAGGAGFLFVSRLLDEPAGAGAPTADPEAGVRFQHHLAQLVLREGRVSRETAPLVMAAPEINAFLNGHVEVRRLPLRPVVVRLGRDRVEVAGRTTLRRLVRNTPLADLWGLAPARLLDQGLWFSAGGRLRVGSGRGQLIVEDAALGRQGIPQAVLWRLLRLSPAELLTWRAPRVIERVEVEPGRLTVHTRR